MKPLYIQYQQPVSNIKLNLNFHILPKDNSLGGGGGGGGGVVDIYID